MAHDHYTEEHVRKALALLDRMEEGAKVMREQKKLAMENLLAREDLKLNEAGVMIFGLRIVEAIKAKKISRECVPLLESLVLLKEVSGLDRGFFAWLMNLPVKHLKEYQNLSADEARWAFADAILPYIPTKILEPKLTAPRRPRRVTRKKNPRSPRR
jgi:hypothetical protein